MTALTVLDLFSGIGGFSLGLERTGGFKTAAFCEPRQHCVRTLKKNWPGVKVFHDVVSVSRRDVAMACIKPPQVICGGFPCQNLSIASAVWGGNTGLDGEQSGLWGEYARCIDELGPEWAIIENVDRLAGDGLDRILGTLARLGYDAQWDTIPGWFFGAPQARKRLWVVAYPTGKRVEGLFARVRAFAAGSRWPGGAANLLDVAGVALVGDDRFPQPLLRGMDDRPADWMDRLHACGNAVIPQITEAIGRAILAAEEESQADTRDGAVAVLRRVATPPSLPRNST